METKNIVMQMSSTEMKEKIITNITSLSIMMLHWATKMKAADNSAWNNNCSQ